MRIEPETAPDLIGGEQPVQPGRVLCVDDEPNILSALKRLLRQDGYHIETYTSASEALQRMEHQAFDLVMSDQRMPEMMGVEFLRRVKNRWPDAKRIVLSGYTELESVTSAINEGAVYKFLTKPWEDDQLRALVAEALRHKQLEDENRQIRRDLEVVNVQLAEANANLAALVQEQRRWLAADDASLKLAHEILHRLPLAVLGCDVDGLVVFANAAAETLLAHPDNPLLGSMVSQWIPCDAMRCLETGSGPCSVAGLGREPLQVECELMHAGSRVTGCLYILKPMGQLAPRS